MKLLRLYLENVATYEKAEIFFQKLTYPVFVTGRTGSGKTTLFVDAITTALFGCAYGDSSRGSYKAIIMQGKKRGVVELDFEIDGVIYRVRRILDERDPRAYLYRLGESIERVLAYNISKVNSELEKLTGLNYEILLNSVVVRQGEVKDFLRKKPRERRDLLVKIFQIRMDHLKELAKKYRIDLEKTKSNLEGKKRILENEVAKKSTVLKEIKNVEDELREATKREGALRTELERLEKELEELRDREKELSKSVSELEVYERDLRSKKKELERARNEIESFLRIINKFGRERIEKAFDFWNKLNALEKAWLKIDQLKKEKEKLEELLKKKTRISELEKKIRELENVSELHGELEKELERLNERRNYIKGQIRILEQSIEQLEKAKTVCPVCGTPLSPEKKIERKRHLISERENLQRELIEIERTVDEKRNELQRLMEKERELWSTRAKLEELKKEVGENLEEEYMKVANELKQSIERYESEMRVLREFTRRKELSEMKRTLEEMVEIARELPKLEEKEENAKVLLMEIAELERKISQLASLREELEDIQNVIKEKDLRIRELRKQLEQEISKKSKLEEKLKTLQKDLEEIRKKEQRLKEIEDEIKNLDIDIQAYKILEDKVFAPGALPARLLEKYIQVLQYYTNEYLKLFGQPIEVRFIFKQRGDTQTVDLKIYANSYEREIKTFSGGEQTLIGFSIRLAIGKLLTQLYSGRKRPRFLIIDEGFGPLDEELRIEVARALASLMEEGEYEQIIVISHHQELKNDPVFRTVLKIEKDRMNISRVKILQPP